MHRSIKFIIPVFIATLCVVAWVYAGGIIGTASLTVASPTPTPTPGLQTAMNTMLNDTTGVTYATTVGDGTSGISAPPKTFCKTPGSGTICSAQGSVAVGGGEAGAAITNALSTGDVSLPSGTYAVTSGITIPSQRALHCQNGASITLSGSASITLNSATYSFLIDCVISSTATTAPVIISGGHDNAVIGNTISGPSGAAGISLVSSTAHNQVFFNQLTGNTGIALTSATFTNVHLNEISGAMYANSATSQVNVPMPTGMTGGTAQITDFWNVIAQLEPVTCNPANSTCNGYTDVSSNGGDNASALASALSSASAGTGVLLRAGTYNISTVSTVKIPTGKSFICERGVLLNYNNSSGAHASNDWALGIGEYSGTDGNDMILGCELQGWSSKDPGSGPTAPNRDYFSSYNTGIGVDDDSTNSSLPANILIASNYIHDIVGDGMFVFAGSSSTTSGPTDTTVAFNYFNHDVAQSMIHFNGGQNNHAIFNYLRNGHYAFEIDQTSSHPQFETGNVNHNYMGDSQNMIDQGLGACTSFYHTCYAQNGSTSVGACNYANNVMDGGTLSCGPGVVGGTQGTYVENILINSGLDGTNIDPGTCSPCQGTFNWGG